MKGTMKMEQEQVLKERRALVKEGTDKILTTKWRMEGVIGATNNVDRALYIGWHSKLLTFLKMVLVEDSDYIKNVEGCDKNYYVNAESCVRVLESIIEYIEKGFIVPKDNKAVDTSSELKRVFSRFHRVARQLRSRYNNRETIEVNDEYDVQDLLHALLRLYFDDVRAEEWTPSYAGKSARMDFLLKNEKVVIEVKKTRCGLTDKEVGDQLIVDVDRYKNHPDCSKLVCFIYDPEGRIGNPDGMMKDLNDQHAGFAEVIIEPNN